MRARLIIYLGILILGVAIFLYTTKPRWTPWYCGQYSGYNSDAWGTKDIQCLRAGCRVVETGDVIKPKAGEFDTSATYIKCVKK